MKLKTERKTRRRRCKPFLVLPLIVTDSLEESEENLMNMTHKNTGLKLFTKTWPPKRECKNNKNSEELSRPLTATLEKPSILDIRLIGKIDMSKVRKEFLNISNLCRMPLILKNRKVSKISRPLSLPPTEKSKSKVKKSPVNEESWVDEESSSIHSARKIKNNKFNKKNETVNNVKKSGLVKNNSNISDANNNKTFKIPRKCIVTSGKILNVKNDLSKSTKLPEPCKSCGRPEQPERFHSHPVTPLKSAKKMEDSSKVPVKSSVQKPVAIKYKSKTNTESRISPTQKSTTTIKKIIHPTTNNTTNSGFTKQPNSPSTKSETSQPRVKSAKRTLTCYLCGREFGTASLSLHEPKCLQKWERENATLPKHLQRKPPPKPEHTGSSSEWNKLAWESSQSTLTPCHNCGRTFYPDRLIVHQRSCKTPQHNAKTLSPDFQLNNTTIPMSNSTPATPSGRKPPSVECYICGKLFGSNSIKIHERQCLKKWNIENDSLPPDMRSPPPTKNNDKKQNYPEAQQQKPSTEDVKEKEERPTSSRKPPLFPCYICGKLFTVNSIYIHEPQCLKKWKIENDKLPSNKRRPQPLKPDVKFTRDGKIDFEATNEANWQSHLSQLVPCKVCLRTFNPDRVDIHERSCKGC